LDGNLEHIVCSAILVYGRHTTNEKDSTHLKDMALQTDPLLCNWWGNKSGMKRQNIIGPAEKNKSYKTIYFTDCACGRWIIIHHNRSE